MTYVIVQNCCNDASCIDVCPVDCIHPTPDEPDFLTAEMLYINPADCIDCGACVDACPVGAIHADYEIPAHLAAYQAVNEDYFAWMGATPEPVPHSRSSRMQDQGAALRVAVVGAGPSGWYTVDGLLSSDRAEVEVTLIDRVPFSHGLVRYGVAPDHEHTKGAGELFERLADSKRVSLLLGVEVGTDVTHDELLAQHHAVVYCTGAGSGRRLDLPGEVLDGVTTSAELVQWYNGHPDYADRSFDLSCERVVVIGNGNVALDVARLLLTPADQLAGTDMADYALAAFRASKVREVVVLGRRGSEHAAFTSPELRALLGSAEFDVVLDGSVPVVPEADGTAAGFAAQQKARLLQELADRPYCGDKRIVLRFDSMPVAIEGEDRAEAIRVRHNVTGLVESIDAGLVVSATGFRSEPVTGLPFDIDAGRFEHVGGRVLNRGRAVPGVYAAGWVKRGPSGVIGTNRLCAAETVASLLDDAVAGVLASPTVGVDAISALLDSRRVRVVDAAGWRAIREYETDTGHQSGRPRRKLTSRAAANEIANSAP